MSRDVRYKTGAISAVIIIAEILFWMLTAVVWFYVPVYFEQFRFERPQLLWALLLLPLYLLFHLFTIRRKNRNSNPVFNYAL